MQKYIPNGLSILNLISGTVGTVMVFNGCLTYAGYAVFIGAFFDFLDGFAAKLLCAQSPIGKQLDSLADLVTFGILPASILYRLMPGHGIGSYGAYAALGMVVCTALRLARFNVDKHQSDRFIGLPAPANAILVATLPMILERSIYPYLVHGLTEPLVLPLFTILLSYLLIAPLPCMALKFKHFSFQGNRSRYFLLIVSTVLVGLMWIEGIFFSVWFYIIYAVLDAVRQIVGRNR